MKSKLVNLEFSRNDLIILNVYSMAFFQGTAFSENTKSFNARLLNKFGPLFRFEFII